MNYRIQKLLKMHDQLQTTMTRIGKSAEYKKLHVIADTELPELLDKLQSKLGADAVSKLTLLSSSVDIGDEDSVWELLDLDSYISGLLAALQASSESVIGESFVLGAAMLASKVPGVKFDAVNQTLSANVNGQDVELKYSFNMRNPLAQKYIADSAGDLVKNISNDTKLAIKRVLSNAFEYGGSPSEQAEALKQFIGLTKQMQEQVAKYKQSLEEHGLDSSEVTKLVAELRDRKLQERCESIARTETINAANEGLRLAWVQAQHDGLLDAKWVRVWIVTPDDRLCPFCSAMSGKTATLNGSFTSSMDGSKVSGPGLHTRCRCTVSLKETGEKENK